MKKFVKRFSVSIAVSLVMLLVVACGSPAAPTAPPPAPTPAAGGAAAPAEAPAETTEGAVIDFWMQRYGGDPARQDRLMEDLVSRFYEQTGITVNVVFNDWSQALTRYTLASTGGEAPDVADVFFLQSLVQMGGGRYGPMQINDLAAEIGMDRYFDSIIHEAMVGDDFYGIPWRADTRLLAYNRTMFAEAGVSPPTTWDELIEVGQALTVIDSAGNVERAGMAWFTNTARFDQTWMAVLAQAGGRVFTEDFSAPAFNSPEGIASLQFMQDLVYTYNISPVAIIDPTFDAPLEFLAGNTAMLVGSNAGLMINASANAPHMVDQIGAAVMPSRTGTGPSSIAFAAPIAIFRTTDNVEASKEWVRFFTSEEVMIEVSLTLNLLNPNRYVMANEAIQNDPWLSVFAQQFERAQMGDVPIPEWSQISAWPAGPLPLMATEVMAGLDVEDAISRAVAEIENILR